MPKLASKESRRPVQSLPLKEQAYAKLKQQIIQGELTPSMLLSERRLVERLGMSKTPIRAALERLEAEHYVSITPRQGIVIREPSLREITDQFEIRFVLERHVLESLAGKLGADQAQRLTDNLRLQEDAAMRKDMAQSIRLDSAFHVLLCELLGNQEILRVMQQVHEKFARLAWLVFRKHVDRLEPSWREHCAIAEAVIRGNPGAAVEHLKNHLSHGKRALLGAP
jgi:DNA-binding GntR family transcriptional regulator